MTANTSPAVRQQRTEAKDSLDDFPTPPWGTRALCEFLQRELREDIGTMTVREPAANRGHMVRPLTEYFASVIASDVADYGAGFPLTDYTMPGPDICGLVDWTITNPPFRLGEEFITRALQRSLRGAAMLVRSAFLEGDARWSQLYRDQPPTEVLQFTQRLPMNKASMARSNGTATSYAWLIWRHGVIGTRPTHLHWTGLCRDALIRDGDYPARPDGLAQIEGGKGQ